MRQTGSGTAPSWPSSRSTRRDGSQPGSDSLPPETWISITLPQIEPAQVVGRVEAEVVRHGVDVVQIEQQVTARRAHAVHEEARLVERRRRAGSRRRCSRRRRRRPRAASARGAAAPRAPPRRSSAAAAAASWPARRRTWRRGDRCTSESRRSRDRRAPAPARRGGGARRRRRALPSDKPTPWATKKRPARAQRGEAAVKAVGLEPPVVAAAPQRLGRDLAVVGVVRMMRSQRSRNAGSGCSVKPTGITTCTPERKSRKRRASGRGPCRSRPSRPVLLVFAAATVVRSQPAPAAPSDVTPARSPSLRWMSLQWQHCA